MSSIVTFTGRVGKREIADYLSTASLGVSPDPLNPLNDVSTMNKTMEYMAYALPVVAFRLHETVVSAGDCAVYVAPGDTAAFAAAVVDLLEDGERRGELGAAGRRRAEQVLDWRPQSHVYVGVYNGLLAGRAPEQPASADKNPSPVTHRDASPAEFVPIEDDVQLRRFAADRVVSTITEGPTVQVTSY